MPNILPALNEYVRKLARREIRSQTGKTKKATAQYRRDIAALKRLLKTLAGRISYLEKHGGSARPAVSESAVPENTRFRADGLRTHRAKLGISAKDFGRLIGVSGLTVYNWEAGKSRPRRRQLASLVTVRGIGKREADKRLALLDKK